MPVLEIKTSKEIINKTPLTNAPISLYFGLTDWVISSKNPTEKTGIEISRYKYAFSRSTKSKKIITNNVKKTANPPNLDTLPMWMVWGPFGSLIKNLKCKYKNFKIKKVKPEEIKKIIGKFKKLSVKISYHLKYFVIMNY